MIMNDILPSDSGLISAFVLLDPIVAFYYRD